MVSVSKQCELNERLHLALYVQARKEDWPTRVAHHDDVNLIAVAFDDKHIEYELFQNVPLPDAVCYSNPSKSVIYRNRKASIYKHLSDRRMAYFGFHATERFVHLLPTTTLVRLMALMSDDGFDPVVRFRIARSDEFSQSLRMSCNRKVPELVEA